MSALQSYLRNGGTVAELTAKYAIKASRHPAHENLVLFKYNQIDSPFAEPIVQAARGPILDESNNWNFVSRPFDKFFNHGEGHAAKINWASANVDEKLDGSLVSIYNYKDEWYVATSGTPDASGDVNGMGFTFKELFWRVWNEMGLVLPPADHRDMTFMFELTTPYNRVVVRHETRSLALLAVRNRYTGREYPRDMFFYPAVKSFPLGSFDQITATFDTMNPLAQEGYVVRDADGNRVKVKHPGYVAIHHLREGFGPKRVLEIIRSGESSELTTHFPEWKEDFDRIQAVYLAFVSEVEAAYEKIKDIVVQKDFALEAVKTPLPGALFALRKGQTSSVRAYAAEMQIQALMKLLRIKEPPPSAEEAV